jgi:hypothetical protein
MQVAKHNSLFGRAFAVAALSAVAALVACGGGSAPPAKVSSKSKSSIARGGGPVSLVTAVDTIANERCMHEVSCDRIGAGRRFPSKESCQKSLVHEARGQLKTDVCDTGYVEPDSLLDCLTAIRAGGCAAETEAACEPSSMCSP